MIEAKAVGFDLKEQFVKQAVDYAANQGVEMGVADQWRRVACVPGGIQEADRARVGCGIRPVGDDPRKADDLEVLALLSKEGWLKARLGALRPEAGPQSLHVGGGLVGDTVLEVTRREVRRLAPEVRVDARRNAARAID